MKSIRIIILFLTLFGCGESVEIEESNGNASLVLDVTIDKGVEGQDITINRVRVWKSTPNNAAPGSYNEIDKYAVEVWVTLSGEEGQRYRLGEKFFADGDGNLYSDKNEPGAIVYADKQEVGGDVATYTVSAQYGFIKSDFPAYGIADTGVSDSSATKIRVNPAEIADSPWVSIRKREVDGIFFERERSVINSDFSQTGKLGCAIRKVVSGVKQSRTYLFQDIELGKGIQHAEGSIKKDGSDEDKSGDDNRLRIDWSEKWYITGLNIFSKKMTIFRAQSAPFYNGRELPNVDTTDSTPNPSGIEKLVRRCNSEAGAGGEFYLVNIGDGSAGSADSETASYQESGGFSYCSVLDTAASSNANGIDLTNTDYGCGFTGVLVEAGTWSGAAHTGSIQEISGSHFYFDQTPISEISLEKEEEQE